MDWLQLRGSIRASYVVSGQLILKRASVSRPPVNGMTRISTLATMVMMQLLSEILFAVTLNVGGEIPKASGHPHAPPHSNYAALRPDVI
jgi:hypothetical protein